MHRRDLGLSAGDLTALDAKAKEKGVACFVAPNFALGAALMMRFAGEAAKHMPKAEIVELHHEAKLDAPSGTAKATAESPGEVPIHSVRLPGLLAHQEVIFGVSRQTLTIRRRCRARRSCRACSSPCTACPLFRRV